MNAACASQSQPCLLRLQPNNRIYQRVNCCPRLTTQQSQPSSHRQSLAPRPNLSRFKVFCTTRGENDSRNILDAFFLGKSLAEALNERVETTIGELLSAVGRLQAEQQKQVQDLKEEVLERAKRAKEKAAREALEAQGLIPKPATTVNSKTAANGSSMSGAAPSGVAADLTIKSPASPADSGVAPTSEAIDEHSDD